MPADTDAAAASQQQIDDAEWRNPANWRGGPLGLYYSRRDSRAFVPKRNPVRGVTINFAHRTGVAFLVGVLVVVCVVALTAGR